MFMFLPLLVWLVVVVNRCETMNIQMDILWSRRNNRDDAIVPYLLVADDCFKESNLLMGFASDRVLIMHHLIAPKDPSLLWVRDDGMTVVTKPSCSFDWHMILGFSSFSCFMFFCECQKDDRLLITNKISHEIFNDADFFRRLKIVWWWTVNNKQQTSNITLIFSASSTIKIKDCIKTPHQSASLF